MLQGSEIPNTVAIAKPSAIVPPSHQGSETPTTTAVATPANNSIDLDMSIIPFNTNNNPYALDGNPTTSDHNPFENLDLLMFKSTSASNHPPLTDEFISSAPDDFFAKFDLSLLDGHAAADDTTASLLPSGQSTDYMVRDHPAVTWPTDIQYDLPHLPLPPPPGPSSFNAQDVAAVTQLLAPLADIPSAVEATYAAVLSSASRWGEKWCKCVVAFVEFERSRNFNTKSYILPTSKERPNHYKQWYSLQRPSSGPDWDALGEGDGAAFGSQWWAWWVDIQPAGRCEEGKFTLARRDVGHVNWKRLSKSGPTGLFLVLLGLVWWKMMIGEADEDWSKAVVDVTWAIHEMKSNSAASANANPVKRKRYVRSHFFLISSSDYGPLQHHYSHRSQSTCQHDTAVNRSSPSNRA